MQAATRATADPDRRSGRAQHGPLSARNDARHAALDVVDPAGPCAPSDTDVNFVPISAEDATGHAVLFKALSDPVRLRLFLHISAANCSSVCACHLPQLFGVSQPTLSHHLKKLTDAGLVHREMRGRWAHYTVRPETVAIARNVLTACC